MKWLGRILIFWLVLLVGSVLALNFGLLHDPMQKWLSQKLGGPVELGPVQVPFSWPLSLRLGPTRAQSQGISLQWQQLVVQSATFLKPYDFRIYLTAPTVKLNFALKDFSSAKTETAAQPTQPPPAAAVLTLPFRLYLKIDNGTFEAKDLGLSALNVEFDQRLWLKSPARIQASVRVKSGALPGEWPLSIKTDGLIFSPESIKSEGLEASFAGLVAKVQGTSLLKEGRHRWRVVVQAPDLSRLPKPPFEIPASGWKGAIDLNAEVIKEAQGGWQVDGRLQAHQVQSQIKWQKDKLKVDGPVAINLKSRFAYRNEKLLLPELTGALDATSAHIEAKDMLNKKSGVPLTLDLAVEGDDQRITIKKFAAHFWKVQLGLTGQVDAKAPYKAQLALQVAPTALKGLDGVLLPLKRSPVQGELAIEANFKGPVTQPKLAQILIQSLKLHSFHADINYELGKTIKANGPVKANVDVQGELDQGEVKKIFGTGQIQLGGMALVAGPFVKAARQAMDVQFALKSQGTDIQIDQLSLRGYLGQFKASGRISNFAQPTLTKVNVEIHPLELTQLATSLPDFREKIPKGRVEGQVALNGFWNSSKPWNEQQLDVSGDVRASLPGYLIESHLEAPKVAEGGEVAKPAEPSSLLPRGEFISKLDLRLSVRVGTLQKGDLFIKGVDGTGQIRQGVFTGQGEIQEIFGAQVRLNGLHVPLVQLDPMLRGQVEFRDLIVENAIGFAKPEYKTFASGRLMARLNIQSRMPSNPRFMSDLKVGGQAEASPITLNTVRMGDLMNGLIEKIPMVKLPSARLDPLKGVIRSSFDYSNQTLNLNQLSATDQDGSQLFAKGKVTVPDLQGDLTGQFHWKQSEIKGCLAEGNADSEGRLIVPLAIKGDLMKPQMTMVTDMITSLGRRALECEKNKAVEKLKVEGTKKLEEEAGKLLKGFLGH